MKTWSKIAALTVFALGALLAPQQSWGIEGIVEFNTPHCSPQFPGAARGLAIDDATNTLYVADRNGEVCVYSLNAFGVEIDPMGSIPHPFIGANPFFTQNKGLAFNPVGALGLGSLWMLHVDNAVTPIVNSLAEFDTAGVQIGTTITLDADAINGLPPGTGSEISPSGLTFDTLAGTLWYRDTVQDTLVNIDTLGSLVGTPLQLPGNLPSSGEGLYYNENLGQPYLSLPYGDVFEYQATRTIQIDIATGQLTGIEIGFSELYALDPNFAPRAITHTADAAGVTYVCSDTTVYKVSGTASGVVAPSFFNCSSNLDGTVELSWTNHAAYTTLLLFRVANGVEELIQALPPISSSYTDTNVSISTFDLLNQDVTYRIIADGAESLCTLRTGQGSVLGYTLFAGVNPYGIASDPNTGEIFITDDQDTRIYVYDEDLVLLYEILLDFRPRGIAFDPLTGQLVVGNNEAGEQNLLRFLDPANDANPATPELDPQSEVPAPGSGVQVSGITFDTVDNDFLLIDEASGDIIRMEAEHIIIDPDGREASRRSIRLARRLVRFAHPSLPSTHAARRSSTRATRS